MPRVPYAELIQESVVTLPRDSATDGRTVTHAAVDLRAVTYLLRQEPPG